MSKPIYGVTVGTGFKPHEAPTKVSQLENDSGFVTQEAIKGVYDYINEIHHELDRQVFDLARDVIALQEQSKDYVTEVYLDERLENIASQDYVDNKVQDLATKEELNDAIGSANAYTDELKVYVDSLLGAYVDEMAELLGGDA